MAKQLLNKNFLHKQRIQLSLYRKVLPSLELKRQQLIAELIKARRALTDGESNYQNFIKEVAQSIPMLANQKIDHNDFLKVTSVEKETENVVGVKLPLLKHIEFKLFDYPVLGKPAWSEMFIKRYKQGIEMAISIKVLTQRVEILEVAYKKTTQKVNLFEKVLIPEAITKIKKIQIALDDMDRASVVRSKLAKSKHNR
ncbi:MAG: V-type ATP synthase subunit D [Epsilonproteobacteria bacterium]|nr:V-type ATP synthase subunit D [Campylobacterota bacterium]